MEKKVCACGNQFTESQSSGDSCFKCKLRSVGFGFRGPTRATRDDFHNNTIRSVIEKSDRDITAAGGNPKDYEPVGQRWV